MTKIEKCWCGSQELDIFSEHYYKCKLCNTLISKHIRPGEFYKGSDESDSLYGKEYWLKHVKEDYGLPDIIERSRTDIPERCIYWLRHIFKYKLPPAKTLELGCAHGGLVYLMKLAGYDATGDEMSEWICNFAKETFNIPMICGPIEELNIPAKSLDMVLLMDVLEHMTDPLKSLEFIADALKDDGIIVIQTPCWREVNSSFTTMKEKNSIFLPQFKEQEHLYLFNQMAIEQLLAKARFSHIEFEAQIFPYDMFIFAGKKKLTKVKVEDIAAELLKTPEKRMILALVDLYVQKDEQHALLMTCEEDRAARLKVIERQESEFSERMGVCEADRAARLAFINELQKKYEESEADRAARLAFINNLQKKYEESEADRAARLEFINNLQKKLETSEQELMQKCELLCRSENENESIKTSLSWIITAPLRKFYKLFQAKLK